MDCRSVWVANVLHCTLIKDRGKRENSSLGTQPMHQNKHMCVGGKRVTLIKTVKTNHLRGKYTRFDSAECDVHVSIQ